MGMAPSHTEPSRELIYESTTRVRDMTDVFDFGTELRTARIRANLKQSDVAAHMGWHSTSISQLERGDRANLPDFRTVKKLDRFLNAKGKLLTAAGFKAPAGSHTQPIFTVTIPQGFTAEETAQVHDYIDLIQRANHSTKNL
jgi:transcriptional regulator with XRE-family HTH domain